MFDTNLFNKYTRFLLNFGQCCIVLYDYTLPERRDTLHKPNAHKLAQTQHREGNQTCSKVRNVLYVALAFKELQKPASAVGPLSTAQLADKRIHVF